MAIRTETPQVYGIIDVGACVGAVMIYLSGWTTAKDTTTVIPFKNDGADLCCEA